MPTPVKPCEGFFSEEQQELLQRNKDRAQWAAHRCQVCGLEVSVVQVKGKWVPQPHWPSVKYPARGPSGKRAA